MIVDCAVYEDGERREGDLALEDAAQAACDDRPSFVWLGVHEPSAEEFDAVRREFNLHELAVEDAVEAHERPKLEVYGETLFVVLKTVRYIDHEEVIRGGQTCCSSTRRSSSPCATATATCTRSARRSRSARTSCAAGPGRSSTP